MMTNLFPTVTNDDFLFPQSFDDAISNLFNSFAPSYKMPKVDIEDKGDSYELTTDLPGMTKEDIKLSYENDVLTISAKHEEKKEDKDEQKHYIVSERSSQSYARQFVVHNIDKDNIKASFEGGILKVALPKVDPKTIDASHQITIE